MTGVLVFLAVAAAATLGHKKPERAQAVVFVCEHGSVKSLIAREWFGRLAAERGVGLRGVSRGVTPDASVPAVIAEQLRRDGFDISRFEPRPLVPADLDGALRLVAIGAELPAWVSRSGVAVERWDDIPPATEGYEGSRDALRSRILSMLETLVARTQPR